MPTSAPGGVSACTRCLRTAGDPRALARLPCPGASHTPLARAWNRLRSAGGHGHDISLVSGHGAPPCLYCTRCGCNCDNRLGKFTSLCAPGRATPGRKAYDAGPHPRQRWARIAWAIPLGILAAPAAGAAHTWRNTCHDPDSGSATANPGHTWRSACHDPDSGSELCGHSTPCRQIPAPDSGATHWLSHAQRLSGQNGFFFLSGPPLSAMDNICRQNIFCHP